MTELVAHTDFAVHLALVVGMFAAAVQPGLELVLEQILAVARGRLQEFADLIVIADAVATALVLVHERLAAALESSPVPLLKKHKRRIKL